MTAKEALWLIRVQLTHTEQNLQAIKVLSDIVSIFDKTHIDDAYGTEAHPHNMGYDDIPYQLYGTEEQHFKNHLDNIAKRDLKKHSTDTNNDKKNKKGETQ